MKLRHSLLVRGEMAQQGIQMNQAKFECSICLDLLKVPVTILCGHSYCMRCIKHFWDGEDRKRIYSCPLCRQTFRPRPALVKNTMLADLVGELKKTEHQAALAYHCYAGPADVGCDCCTGRKLKAIKSCLQCLVSYCDQHLQPHYDSPGFKNHKLVAPSNKLQENICTHHGELMKIFCLTDQQCICYLCSIDKHKGHETVSVAAERTKRQIKLTASQRMVKQRIRDIQKDVNVLQQEVKDINQSADEAVTGSEEIFIQLIRLLEKRSSEVTWEIRVQQKTEVSRAKKLQKELEQEITELKRKDAELQQLSHTEDHIQFLHHYKSLPLLRKSTPLNQLCPLRYFENVSAAVSKVTGQLQNSLNEGCTKISLTLLDVDVLLSPAAPKTRYKLLQYAHEMKLDPNTASKYLSLSEGDRRVTCGTKRSYADHPDRFTDRLQVLSRESLPRRCYWEVEWIEGQVVVAVACNDIQRTGSESRFGYNEKSWSLFHQGNRWSFMHNSVVTPLSVLPTSIVGVYLDQAAGCLSFYGVSDTMMLLHRVRINPKQPLYAGLRLYLPGDIAQLRCKKD
ncbi:tripartite motif-containing protein 16-like [Genypterus blacodes]|uniref:tripartite motif-containing protein 16-like n=1 Tax=Genypterus blacodes TaxID=154954 RepID=UPI003F771B58